MLFIYLFEREEDGGDIRPQAKKEKENILFYSWRIWLPAFITESFFRETLVIYREDHWYEPEKCFAAFLTEKRTKENG